MEITSHSCVGYLSIFPLHAHKIRTRGHSHKPRNLSLFSNFWIQSIYLHVCVWACVWYIIRLNLNRFRWTPSAYIPNKLFSCCQQSYICLCPSPVVSFVCQWFFSYLSHDSTPYPLAPNDWLTVPIMGYRSG